MKEQELIDQIGRIQDEYERLIGIKMYEAALPLIQELTDLILREADNGSDAHDICVYNFACTLFYLNRYRESAQLHGEVLRSRERKGKNTDESDERSLSHLVECYYLLGDYVSAEPVVRRLMSIRRKRGSVLQEMCNLAVCLREQGKNEDAAELYLQIISESKAIFSTAPESYAVALNNYAIFLKRTGNCKEAISYYLEAVNVLANLKSKQKEYLQTLANLANAYDEVGEDTAAAETYRNLFSVLDDNGPDFALDVRALALNNQAQEDLNRGNHQGARKKLQEAAEIVKKVHGESHPLYATAITNLGVFYVSLGDIDKAEIEFRLALDIRLSVLGNSSPEVAHSLNNLGAIARSRGDLPSAIHLLQESLAAKRRMFKGANPSLAISMNNVGTVLMLAERWDEAEAIFLDALQVLEDSVGNHSSDYAQTLQNLGDMYKRRGDYQKAESYFDRAREKLLGKYGSSENLVLTTINLAELYAVTKRADEALSMMNEVAVLDESTISRVFSIASERQRMSFLHNIQTRDHVRLSLMLWKFRDSGNAVYEAFSRVLKRKSLGAEALSGQRDGILGGRYPDLRLRLDELTQIKQQIAMTALAGSVLGGRDAHANHLKKMESLREDIEVDLAGRIPEIELSKRLEDAAPEAIAQKLPSDTVLVEFLRLRVRAFDAVVARREQPWKPDKYIAFVMAFGKPNSVSLLDLGDAVKIDNLMITYRELASIPLSQRKDSLEDASKRLRNAVFDPLVPLLNGSQKLVLCPDSELNMLSFEALAFDDGRLVMEDYLISYLTCARDSLRFGLPPFGTAGASVVVADPSYNLTSSTSAEPGVATRSSKDIDRGIRFGRLWYTREEGEKIAELLGVTPWLGDDALESRVKQARSPRVLHLATHGFVLPDQVAVPPIEPANPISEQRLTGIGMENPLLRSGLALAGANIWLRGGNIPAEAEDGILTAEDVTGMDLLDTELVVLSACETGLGKVHVGEGVFGLRRAFVVAGARRLVMSLWKVPDQQTQQLMVEFYKRVAAGDGGAEALRGAKLAMKAFYPDTFYWAAFIFLGDPSPFQVTDSM